MNRQRSGYGAVPSSGPFREEPSGFGGQHQDYSGFGYQRPSKLNIVCLQCSGVLHNKYGMITTESVEINKQL